MPAISTRAAAMPASPIRKLVPFAEAAKARGVKVYHLNIGQPDLPTPPQFFEAIKKADIKVLEYSHSAGLESYRRKMVQYYAHVGITGLSHHDIMITTGGSEALRFAFMTCLNPGDEIIVPEPFYANYLGFAVESGLVIKPITTYIQDSFALPPIGEFEKLIGPCTKAILLCNPSNPTGKLYSRADLEKLRDIVQQHDLYLFSDEVYKEFAYDGQSYTSALQLQGIEKNVLVVDSVSKRYSECGARIGSLVCRNPDVMSAALKFAQARLSPPTLGQIGSEALIDLPESYYAEVAKEYCARRDVVLEALNQMPGVVCPKVSGAFYVMPQLPIDDSDKFCQWLLEHFVHDGATVMMAPGTGFYATPGLGKQEVRIAYVLKTDVLRKAMATLAAALQAYPGRTVSTPAAALAK